MKQPLNAYICKYTDVLLLASAVYSCSSSEDRHLHL